RVLNKSDQPSKMGNLDGIRTIATTGEGVDEVRRRIIQFFCSESPIKTDRPRWWTERQRQILQRAVANAGALDDI
ncbi:MAG TPA: hypothetical protein VN541_00420, partial [Tepidisphaeraceae bacterium]|nr:hypothetical protein [Tepidisphaeraceae bacterium]